MALDSSKSCTSQSTRNPNHLLPASVTNIRGQNFKYLPPPRLYQAEDLGVPYPYISTFAGPVTSRTVTDKPYLVLLVIFAVVWIFLLLYAFANSFLSLGLLRALKDDSDARIPSRPIDFFTIIQILFSIMSLVVVFSMLYLILFLHIPRAMVYVSFVLWVMTVIVVTLFIEAFIIAYTSFDYNVFKVFGFLNVSFSIRAIILICIIYFKIIYANALQIAIDLIILVLQFIKEIRAVILIPLIPSIIAIMFTSVNIGIIYLLVHSEENLIIHNLESSCKCINGYKNGSNCTIPGVYRNRNATLPNHCSPMTSTSATKFSGLVVLSFIFIIFFLLWCYETLFTILTLVMDNIYAKYYFNQISGLDSTQVLKESLILVLRYHSGTAAYGALAMMSLQFPSFLVNRIDRIIHLRPYCFFQPIDSLSPALTSRSSCVFLNFMNHFRGTVFVFTALFGFKFQDAFDHNFKLIFRNAERFYVPDMLIDTIFKAAKWTLMGITCVTASYSVCSGERVCFGNTGDTMHTLKYVTVILLICATTYTVISYCFSIISSAVNTVYICFLTESEMLSFKLPEEPERWEINNSRQRQLFECLYRPPPPQSVNQNVI